MENKPIRRIDVRIKTARGGSPGSDGRFYISIGGREFRLNIPGTDDFEDGMDQIFTLGEGSNVGNAEYNDPRDNPRLFMEDLKKYPKYIRFEPENDSDDWHLGGINVTINPGDGQWVYSALNGSIDDGNQFNVWLGARNTKIFYFGG
jgi:hypothetical protein